MCEFPERLASERNRLGLTQAVAAERCGVTRAMWGRYERGVASMGCDVLMLFAELGADVGYILTGKGAEPSLENPLTLSAEQSARLQLAIEAVEEGLQLIKRKLAPEQKARLILAAFDLLAEPESAKGKVVELIRLVA